MIQLGFVRNFTRVFSPMFILNLLLRLALLGLTVAMFSGFLGELHPVFDTASNFRWHLALLLFGLAALAILIRKWNTGITALIIAMFAAWQAM